MLKALVLLMALLWAANASAASPEFCGDGIDDSLETGGSAAGTYGSCPANYHNSVLGTGHGCDADCDAPDKDNDGYTSDGTLGNAGTTYTDCNDGNMWDYPGVYVPNSWDTPTGYKLCQTNGTYGSTVLTATTPLCQATGGAKCLYVDCGNSLGSASDSNAGTLYTAPKLTHGSIPALVNDDDYVYFIGSGTCTESVTYTDAGTSGHLITIARYPGHTAKLDSTSATIVTVDFMRFDLLDINGTSAMIDSSLAGADDVEISRVYIHDLNGGGTNNHACLRFQHSTRQNTHHTLLEDCNWDGLLGSENISALLWLCESTECADMSAKFNTFYWTNSPTNGGGGIYLKHGNIAANAGTTGTQFKWNTMIYCGIGTSNCIYGGASKLRAEHNRILPNTGALRLYDAGGSTATQDNWFRYNTIISGATLSWTPLWYSTGSEPQESLTIERNIFVNQALSYAVDGGGIYSLCLRDDPGQCTALNRTDWETNDYLTSDYNWFYSPNVAAQFSYFMEGGGGNYSFANFKSQSGQDFNSTLSNPNISAPKYIGSGGAENYGWSASDVSTTTTTTTTTTITVPSGFLAGRLQ